MYAPYISKNNFEIYLIDGATKQNQLLQWKPKVPKNIYPGAEATGREAQLFIGRQELICSKTEISID